ncbi:TPA: hypothetical protein ACGZ9U_003555 [Elizabethkingia anophelis]
MKFPVLATTVISLFFTSCNKNIKSKKGGIDIVSNVYFNASKNLDKVQNFHVSKINYSGDSLIELVPDLEIPGITNSVYFIKDTLYYNLGNENPQNTIISDLIKKQQRHSIYNKKEGAIFTKDLVPNYSHRKNISDTILFGKTYKRFEINSPESYTRYYIYQTDTILPYSIYKHADKDYSGRIERIDSYNKKKDVFVSMQLIPRKKWDKEAKDIFDFNKYVSEKQK